MKERDLIIRHEQVGDIDAIHQITAEAFESVVHSDLTEPFIVRALRNAGALTISLVALEDEQIIGHVAISPVNISDGSSGWYGLGPISVKPSQQNRGVGSYLMTSALKELETINAAGCVLLGEPAYYGRFGFKPCHGFVLPGVPQEYFQAILFRGELPQGDVFYHEAFNVGNEI